MDIVALHWRIARLTYRFGCHRENATRQNMSLKLIVSSGGCIPLDAKGSNVEWDVEWDEPTRRGVGCSRKQKKAADMLAQALM